MPVKTLITYVRLTSAPTSYNHQLTQSARVVDSRVTHNTRPTSRTARTIAAMHSSDSSDHLKQPSVIEVKNFQHGGFSDVELPLRSPLPQNIKAWPSEPLSTHYSWEYEVAMNVFDGVLCLVPIGLIVKASLCVLAAYNDMEQGHVGARIDEASFISRELVKVNSQLTTLFTVCFLVIAATLFKRLALWKAQRGATLAELELLQASVSPTSTLRVMFSLRMFKITSLAMAATWIWYYAGSQAAQRELTIRNSGDALDWRFAILSPDAQSPYEDGTWSHYSPVETIDMSSRYHIYSQDTRGPLFYTAVSDVEEDALPFVFTDAQTDEEFFSTWTPVENRTAWQLASSIGARYYVNKLNTSDTEDNRHWYSKRMIGEWAYNSSLINMQCSNLKLSEKKPPLGLLDSMTMAFNLTNSTTNANDQRTFDFWQRYNVSHALTATCNVSQANVENWVVCSSASCKVEKMRKRPGYDTISPRTLFDDDANARAFVDGILYACGRPTSINDITTFEADNGLSALTTSIRSSQFRFGSLAADIPYYEQQMSYQITKYFNTFRAASLYLKYDHEIDKQELSSINGNFTLDTNEDWVVFTTKAAPYEPYYAISWPWIVLDIVSCSVLLAAAIAAFWLRKRTEAPDIFGYVSSLTRENPRLDPEGGSALSGMERTRKMKHVKVKLGEIPSSDGYGRIGLTYVADGHDQARNLERGKRYR